VELKRVPNCASVVVGNNGFGEFTVWYAADKISPLIQSCLICISFDSKLFDMATMCVIISTCWSAL